MRDNGFTLLELIAALALGLLLLGLAVPAGAAWLQDARRTADVNGFVLAIQVARSEASKRGAAITVCATVDGHGCSDFAGGAPSGWMVFVNADGAYPPARSGQEPLLFTHGIKMRGRISANRPYFEVRPPFQRSVNGTVVFCDARGVAAARAVIVSYTGRPRVASTAADGGPLACAASV
jgi:type IV fimbrial biogenesis protein FimT